MNSIGKAYRNSISSNGIRIAQKYSVLNCDFLKFLITLESACNFILWVLHLMATQKPKSSELESQLHVKASITDIAIS